MKIVFRQGKQFAKAISGFHARHFAALLCTSPASLSATAAMLHMVVLLALGSAGIADACAQATDLGGKSASPTHTGRRLPADRRAIFIQTDALRHHLNVLLAQAGIPTVFALLSATCTGINTSSVLLMGHFSPLSASVCGIRSQAAILLALSLSCLAYFKVAGHRELRRLVRNVPLPVESWNVTAMMFVIP